MLDSRYQEYNHLFSQLITLLQTELKDDLQGILVTGSRIHSTPQPDSDLDVHVIIASPRRRRRNIVLDGIEIEMFFNPAFQIRRYFTSQRGIDQHMFVFGYSIYDPASIVATLQEEARALWNTGPEPFKIQEFWLQRYLAADLLRDIADTMDDDTTNILLVTTLIDQLLNTHYRYHHRWSQKLKRRVNDLKQWDIQAAHLVEEALCHSQAIERYNAIKQLADHILKPLGGIMPLEWSIEWENLEPSM